MDSRVRSTAMDLVGEGYSFTGRELKKKRSNWRFREEC